MTRGQKYLLGHSEREAIRLQQQSRDLARETAWLLDQIGIGPGDRVLDLGCGPQGSLELLAERVGSSGSVVGLEKNAQAAALARAFVRERGLPGVEVVEGDALANGFPRASFDLVHARLVLVNVPNPEEIAREMVALTRPGGVVASHEADYAAHRCDPPHPSWDRLLTAYEAHSRDNGIDLFIGRRTHRLFRAAGLVDIRVNPLIHVYPPGHPRRSIFLDFIDNVRPHLLADGLIGEEELDAHLRALHEHIARPDVLIISHMFFQVWGRTP
ncbi:SAM-dependent methyltransferase [Sorangium cellulosum]|uniref:SAM-dependent methyltransferase n=1 Tax=Sorangium cellulosum TaxID=56 RepID=A0A150SBY0_SORCE|nr:SAM-dependent methyltransferase [Sorangium cellulosum]